MFRLRITGAAVFVLSLAACAGKKAGPVAVEGACSDVYGGQVCTWATTEGGKVTEVGATIPLASIENAPTEGSMDWPPMAAATVPLPESVQQQTGLTELTMFWEAMGHPPGPYLTPHFDFHFYTVADAEVNAIDCSDSSKPSAMPAQYALPDVALPPEMAQLTGTPTLVGLCVPKMGMHALPSTVLDGTTPFTGSMVIGYYAGKPIFVEPMVAKAKLMEKQSFDLPIPEIPGLAGPHPTTFHADYDATKQAYRFVFSGF